MDTAADNSTLPSLRGYNGTLKSAYGASGGGTEARSHPDGTMKMVNAMGKLLKLTEERVSTMTMLISSLHDNMNETMNNPGRPGILSRIQILFGR